MARLDSDIQHSPYLPPGFSRFLSALMILFQHRFTSNILYFFAESGPWTYLSPAE